LAKGEAKIKQAACLVLTRRKEKKETDTHDRRWGDRSAQGPLWAKLGERAYLTKQLLKKRGGKRIVLIGVG